MQVTIHITNLAEVEAAFRAAPAKMAVALPMAINKSLLTIGRKADQLLQEKIYDQPISKSGYKRTGNLLSSVLDPERGLQLATPGVFEGHVGSGVGYGLFVEMGTRFMAARPFLQPAVDETHQVVTGFFTEAVQSVLNDIGGATHI